MNEDTMKGKWKEMTGKVKKKWGKLTDDDLTFINGSSEELSGKIQKHYGYAKDQADKEIHDFMNDDEDDATT
jgi:uncharacterized protein YjbJ (UPF0337 family)